TATIAQSRSPYTADAAPVLAELSRREWVFGRMLRCALMSTRRPRSRRTAKASGHKKGSRSMTLTPEQVRDLAQMSPAMWDMLRSVKLHRGGYSRPPGTAEMLARSGFIEMTK